MFVENQPDITFVWTVKDQFKDELYDNYFNLLIGMIAYAIENGNRNLNLGQTAYYTKQRLGGYDENLFIFFKSTSWFWHNCIKLLKNTFFPEYKLKKIVALKTNTI